jgi:hypothetical protein
MAPIAHRPKRRPSSGRPEDVFFDQWLMPGSPALHALTRWAVGEMGRHEARARGRRPEDQERHEELIGVIVANLARAVLLQPDYPSLAIVKSQNAEAGYERSALRQLSKALSNLEDAGMLNHLPARDRSESGTIRPTTQFAKEVTATRIGFKDFARHPDEEVLELRWSHYDRRGGGSPIKKREELPIRDTPKTRRLRAQVRRLNAFLEAADISIEGGAEAQHIDNFDRRLHRHFTVLDKEAPPAWNLNGRLFGGFWQTLPKSRRHLIRINGRKLADLDYKNLFLRLAYCRMGIAPPRGDLYARLGFEECYRPGIKALVSAFLFARRRAWRIPATLVSSLPPGLTVAEARRALLKAHPKLEAVIETGIGYSLMHTESEVLLAGLERLVREGIVALPMHDGLMVARKDAAAAKATMVEASEAVTGFALPVSSSRVEPRIKNKDPGDFPSEDESL